MNLRLLSVAFLFYFYLWLFKKKTHNFLFYFGPDSCVCAPLNYFLPLCFSIVTHPAWLFSSVPQSFRLLFSTAASQFPASTAWMSRQHSVYEVYFSNEKLYL